MFNISKLSKQSQDYINYLIVKNMTKSDIVNIGLSRVLANKLPLPSGILENINLYFTTQHRMEVQIILCKLNEVMLLDIEKVIDTTLNFYKLRYEYIYPSNNIMAFKNETAIVDFFKISSIFDAHTLEFISCNSIELTESIQRFSNIVNELKD